MYYFVIILNNVFGSKYFHIWLSLINFLQSFLVLPLSPILIR